MQPKIRSRRRSRRHGPRRAGGSDTAISSRSSWAADGGNGEPVAKLWLLLVHIKFVTLLLFNSHYLWSMSLSFQAADSGAASSSASPAVPLTATFSVATAPPTWRRAPLRPSPAAPLVACPFCLSVVLYATLPAYQPTHPPRYLPTSPPDPRHVRL